MQLGLILLIQIKNFQGEANPLLASHLVIISRKGLSVCLSLMLKKFLYLKYTIHSCSFFILMQIYDKKTETQSKISRFVINSRNLILKAVFFVIFPALKSQFYGKIKFMNS